MAKGNVGWRLEWMCIATLLAAAGASPLSDGKMAMEFRDISQMGSFFNLHLIPPKKRVKKTTDKGMYF